MVPLFGGTFIWWCLYLVVPLFGGAFGGAFIWWCLYLVVPLFGGAFGGAFIWWCLYLVVPSVVPLFGGAFYLMPSRIDSVVYSQSKAESLFLCIHLNEFAVLEVLRGVKPLLKQGFRSRSYHRLHVKIPAA